MRRLLALLVPAALAAVLAAGCGPSQADVERTLRKEIENSYNVELTSLNLVKQSNGSYSGTATAANGDTYDVVTNPPKGNRIEWKAVPSQPMVERDVKSGIEAQQKVRVKSLNLTKQRTGVYEGTAELENGVRLTVKTRMDGRQFVWEAEEGVLSQSEIEREVKEGLETQRRVRVKSLKLTMQRTGVYEGTAELEDGTKLSITTRMQGGRLVWEAVPLL